MKNFLLILSCLTFSNTVHGKSAKILNLSCEYDPNLIKVKNKDTGFLEDEKIDRARICRSFGCKDTVQIRKYDAPTSENDDEYRLSNSWFNHQGILLDDFIITENNITISTFVSQAFFLESYQINKNTGTTKRIFYRFDNADFFNDINNIEENSSSPPIYNKNGKLSLNTIKFYSIEPWETFYFEGKCFEGTGV